MLEFGVLVELAVIGFTVNVFVNFRSTATLGDLPR